MHVDPIITIAFTISARPGAYALLVGSGVSTGAGVPTGWQILEELIRRLATVEGGYGNEQEPAEWYQRRFGESPTYPSVMEALAPTKPDRQALIGSFLAPDTEAGVRVPTEAHRAIARLIKGGLVRVVLTTNFDRLIEQACSEVGIELTVLASADDVAGALPLVHIGPVLVKLNGDQTDPRIRNTERELDQYEGPIKRLLDQVFDEYGLIVCGWSGASDAGIRAAMARATNHRFATFWCAHGNLNGEAERLARQRRADVVPIEDADEFFGRLADACDALADVNRAHPLSVAAAVATCKRDLAGDTRAIPVHDMLRTEIERVHRLDLLTRPTFEQAAVNHHKALLRLEAELELLAALTATTTYWGNVDSDRWWFDEIGRFAPRLRVSGDLAMIDLVKLPGLVMLWAAGMAALAAERWDLLGRLTAEPVLDRASSSCSLPAAQILTPDLLHVGDAEHRLFRLFQPVFVEHLAVGNEAYMDLFERWQYLLAILAGDIRLARNENAGYFRPLLRADGGFTREGRPVVERWVLDPLDRLGTHPVAALFDGDVGRVRAAAEWFGKQFAEETMQRDGSLLRPGSAGSLPTGLHYPGHFHADIDRL